MTDLGARTMDRPDQPVRNPPRATAVTRTPNGTTSGARADRCLPAMRGRAPSLLSPGHAAQAPGHGHLRAESWSKPAGPSLIDPLPAQGSVNEPRVRPGGRLSQTDYGGVSGIDIELGRLDASTS